MSSPRTGDSQREHRFEQLVGSVRDYAIFMLDAQGRIETWNLGARAIKGYAPEEIIGQPLDVFYTPADREAGHPQKLLARARADGSVEDIGWRVRKDGTRFYADVVITAIRDETGDLVGYAKVTRDLTEKRREEERRFEAEQRFRQIVEAVRDYAIFMLDATGNVATWNPGAERIVGYSPEEIIGTHFSVFYPSELRHTGHPEAELRTALTEGKFEEEAWRIRKDGSRYWASVVLTPVFSAEHKHLGFVKVTRDLTEQREAARERDRLVQAHEAIRLRDDFLSIASHELRTPLMALQLQLESTRKLYTGKDTRLEAKLERIDRSARRLGELVDTLLDVTRIASGKLTLHPAECDLSAVVAEVCERMQEAALRAECPFEVDLESGMHGRFDALRMSQVVINLLANAFKYAAKAPVELRARRHGDRFVLTVTDHGPGLAESNLERIFERFERAADPRHFGGMGLGLYVARQIVTEHGGQIHATSRPGTGARFTVELPARGVPL